MEYCHLRSNNQLIFAMVTRVLLEVGTESSVLLLLWQSRSNVYSAGSLIVIKMAIIYFTLIVKIFQSAGKNMKDASKKVLTITGASLFTQDFQTI
jgi:hypothetical protein